MSSILGRAAADVQVSEEYPEETLLPAGPHQAVATDITEGRNDERGEDWVKVMFEITSGPYTGAKIADWWGFGGSEAKEQISNKKFKTLMTLCGVHDTLNSYDQLMMVPITINNKPYRGKTDGVMRNSINYYKRAGAPVAGGAPVQVAPSPSPSPAPAPSPVAAQMQAPPAPVMQQAPAPQQYAAPAPMVQQPQQQPPMVAAPPVAVQQPVQAGFVPPGGAAGDPPF